MSVTKDGLIVIAGNWVENIFLLSFYLDSLNTFFVDKLGELVLFYCPLCEVE